MFITPKIDRRKFLRGTLLVAGAASLCPSLMAAPAALPKWEPGDLELHHIDSGLGNCTLIIGPDGTSMMIDAGAGQPLPTTAPARPDGSRRPGEWLARYALQHAPRPRLDYFVTTHIHPDHVGDVGAETPLSTDGTYRLTGVGDVDAVMPITTLIDRAYPEYSGRELDKAPSAQNYLAYLHARAAHGKRVEAAQVGSSRQIVLQRDAQRFQGFEVQVLAANGAVWNRSTGQVENAEVPSGARLPENSMSVALRLSYGPFTYFTGGDLTCETEDGRSPWIDRETPVVRSCGRVEVAVADHHGYFDACGPEFVRNLDAQVYIIPAWDIGHPGSAQMQRMLGDWEGAPKHDVFALDLLPQNALLNRRFAPHLKTQTGHVVVRVSDGGKTYRIYQVDSTQEHGSVLATFGPYRSRTVEGRNRDA